MALDADPFQPDTVDRTISLLRHGRTTVVVLTGELDLSDAIEFRPLCDEILEADRPLVVVDAGGVTFVDCGFIGELVTLAADCGQRHGHLRIATASDAVRRVCDLLDLDHLVGLAPRTGCPSRRAG